MSNRVQQLRDAVIRPDREIEVHPDGSVHEVDKPDEADATEAPKEPKATRLAPRVFGA